MIRNPAVSVLEQSTTTRGYTPRVNNSRRRAPRWLVAVGAIGAIMLLAATGMGQPAKQQPPQLPPAQAQKPPAAPAAGSKATPAPDDAGKARKPAGAKEPSVEERATRGVVSIERGGQP